MSGKADVRFVILFFGLILFSLPGFAQERSLRFFGNGTGDIDRVKIPLDSPHRPIDVGDDFTIEFWMKANLADNSGTVDCSSNVGGDRWITGNTIFDRDIYGAGDYGDYGIALGNGRIIFGVDAGAGSITLCGTSNVADNVWHHIAVTRRRSDGQMQIFVDGVRQAIGNGGTGNASYRNNRPTAYPNSDPYLVIGAEKHDAGPLYPSYNGFIDEIRVSNNVRYTANFTRPSMTFLVDANTVALYHLNEGSGNFIGDVLGTSNGVRNFGGSPNAGPVWSTESPFVPTSANAGISGRVNAENGLPLVNVELHLVNLTTNETFTTFTDADGAYQFGNIATGYNYLIMPRRVWYRFTQNSQVFFHSDERTGLNFVGRWRKKWR